MKKFTIFSLLFFALLIINSCQDKVYMKFIANVPVYMDYTSFRTSVKYEAPRMIKNHGNIYKKDQFLLIIEENEGIHFIDNSNPTAPLQVGFLKILGCTGIAMKEDYLFANSYVDLVVLDVSSWSNPHEVARLKDLFPQVLPKHNPQYRVAQVDKNLGVVVSWRIDKVKEEAQYQPVWINCPMCLSVDALANSTQENFNSSPNTGISGSITKFSVIDNYLYVMDGFNLHPIAINDPLAPANKQPVQIWRTVETLFAYNNNLFLGTTTGMLIYSVANPDAPSPVSEVNHMTACDPVVVQGNTAYVTVRSGRNCGGTINQLDVIDISNLNAPFIIKSYAMYNPHGLGIDGNILFICDGTAGLKVFNAANSLTIDQNLIQQFMNIQATDIIPHNNIAIMIGSDGLYQYDYSNPAEINLLSVINF